MTHIYYHPIAVTLVGGRPTTMRWRGITYRVLEVNEPWHLMDRWWESPDKPDIPEAPGSGMGGQGHSHKSRSDRTYYRLRCVSAHEDLTCDIYFEAVGGVWILERVYD